MYILDDNIRLHAELQKPEGFAGRCPLVIIIHGFTGHTEERHILAVSDALLELGFATLRVDMYGHGTSDGEFRSHTLFKWMTNAMTVIDYARGLDFVTDLYLLGHSQGGLTVMLAGALKRDVIRAIVPMSPAAMIPEAARAGCVLGMQFDPDRVPESFTLSNGMTLGGNYIRAAQTIRVEDAVRAFRGPVLIVHGDADETVPVQVGIDAANAYANAKLVRIPGDTHCFNNHLDQAIDAVRDWMRGFLETE